MKLPPRLPNAAQMPVKAKKKPMSVNTEGLTEEQAQKLRMMAVIHKMMT